MNKKLIITSLLLLCFSFSFSQVKDTIFYNEYWNVSAKQYAHYYRPLPLEVKKDLYVIKDYFINGNLQMQAFSKDKSGEPFDKTATWFYNNGARKLEKQYDNGKLVGKDKSYFKDGTLMSSAVYRDGKPYEGTFFNSTSLDGKTLTYKQGELVSSNSYYEDSKKIAYSIVYGPMSIYRKTIYFNKKGKIIITAKENSFNYNGVVKVCLSLSDNNNVHTIKYILHQQKKEGVVKEFFKTKKGRVVAEGVYKNDEPFNGKFFKDDKLITYKNGIKNGEVVFYDKNYNEVSKGIYKDRKEFSGDFYQSYSKEIRSYSAGKLVAKQTTNKFTGKKYTCIFDNYKPIDGELFDYSSLKTYKSGKLVKDIDYDSSFGKIKEIIHYNTEKEYQVEKKDFFDNGNKYTVTYKDGIAYSGKEINSYGFITHKEGEVIGPFLIIDKKVTISGNYKNYKKEGVIKYHLKNNDTYTCVFKDGKPIDGTTLEFYNLESYKNGKKEGCGYKTFNNRTYPYDSLQICYKEDLPIGTATYYYKGMLLTSGKYKNGKPSEGVFYNQKEKKVYKNDRLIENEVAILRKYLKQQYLNTNGQIKEEIVRDFNSDTLVYYTLYKKGIPFKGTQVIYDSLNKFYMETDYVDGKKEGEQRYYKNFYKPFVKKYTYKNNIKEGVAQFNASFSDSTYEGVFKKGKAFTGTFVDNNNVFISKTILNKGDTTSVSYYDFYGRNKTAAIKYQNGKPFEGTLFKKVRDKYKDAYKYNNGSLVVSYTRPSRFVNAIEEPTYYNSKTYYKTLKDSILIGKSSLYKQKNSYFIINYTTKAKESGEVKYFENNKRIGQGTFKNNNLTSFKHNGKLMYFNEFTTELVNNLVCYKISHNSYKAEFSSYSTEIKDLKNKYFEKIITTSGNLNSDIKLYVDNTVLSIVKAKEGKPYNGVLFNLEKNNFYSVNIFKNGKKIEVIDGLTKKQLINRMQEFKSKT